MNMSKKEDWHRADVKAALEKAGFSLNSLGRDNGYRPGVLRNIFSVHWPKGERIVANAIGVTAEEIWPSRYVGKTAHRAGVAGTESVSN